MKKRKTTARNGEAKIILNELRNSEKLFRILVENAPQAIFIQTDKHFIYVNAAAVKLFGAKSKRQLIGRPIMERFHPDFHAIIKRRIHLIDKKHKTVPYIEEKYLRLDGSEVDVEVSAVPFKYRGRPGALVFVHDITERKKVEEILSRDRRELKEIVMERTEKLLDIQLDLEKAKRLSDIGMLAATIAHELRSPLAAIGMAASNIKRKTKEMPILESHLNTIEKKINESDRIIDNLLFYSRIKEPQLENVRIYDIVRECIDMAKKEPKKDILVKEDLDTIKDISIKADPVQIKEVCHNILNNAYDAVPGKNGELEIRADHDGRFIKLYFKDNGPGIAKDDLKKIFDPFFSTKAKGTGLGLSVSKQIINLHSGEINIESSLGRGTTVVVTLLRKTGK